jgi:phage gp36-like protein
MPYATQDDMVTRYGEEELIQLTDRVNVEVIDASVLTRAIEDAETEINGYLTKRYSLPLSSVPPILQRLTCDIARYYLSGDRTTEQVRNRYTDVIRLLKSIASGEVMLEGASALASNPVGVNGAMFTAPSRPTVFGRR